MRKAVAVTWGFALIAGMTVSAWAGGTYPYGEGDPPGSSGSPEGSATVAVHAKITANISVQPSQTIVDAGSLQIGDLTANIVFLVHANTEAVQMWVTATDLYKGDQPQNPTVPPIPLKTSAGATISPQGAAPLGGGSNVAILPASQNSTIGNFPAYESGKIVFESQDNGTFSHPVTVTVVWNLTNNEQPQGDYGARVMLSAMVMPM
jgi:hypothetical protein